LRKAEGNNTKVTGGDVIRIDRPIESLGEAKTRHFRPGSPRRRREGQPKIGTPLVPLATVTAELIRP